MRFTVPLSVSLETSRSFRRLGPWGFPEGFHGNALVTNFEYGEVFCAARRLENCTIALCGLHQGASQGRDPTDVVAGKIDLIGAHDAHLPLGALGIGIAHGSSEE